MIGGWIPGGGWEIFSSPPRPDRFSGPRSLLSNGYQRLFLWGLNGRDVKLTTHLYLLPTLMRVAVPPLSQYAFMTWCSVKAQGQLTVFVSKLRKFLGAFMTVMFQVEVFWVVTPCSAVHLQGEDGGGMDF
jgi:hypothetical protein